MAIDVKAAVKAVSQEVLALRRDIHMHPELGFQEFRTAQIVEDILNSLGMRVRRCAGTGVIGVLEGGKPGKTIMLRCELDALPLTEENDLPFCSVNPGAMHACGHDCNCAIQLGVAKVLAAHREELCGTVVFMFQPNEEDCGAPPMIEDGALADPRPDAIIGPHVWSQLPIGTIGVVPGPQCASSYYFKVTIRGKDTAGYMPWNGVSPITCARHVLDAIDSIQVMEFSSPEEPTLITVGMIHSGNYMINISAELELQGSIRCLHSNEKKVHDRFREIVEGVCKAYRCECDVEITCGNKMLENDEALYQIMSGVCREQLGPESVLSKNVRGFGGDDMADFFCEGIPGCYYLLGMGNPAKGSTAAHHNKDFLVDEDVLDIGVELQVRAILRYLDMQ